MAKLSRNTKRGVFTIASLLMMASARAADVAFTYHYAPDLSNEANPIVSLLGGGWAALLIVNILLVLAICACAIYWWRRPLTYHPSEEVTNTWEFASHCYCRKVYSRSRFLFYFFCRFPKNWPHAFQLYGFTLPAGVILVSLLGGSSWPLMRVSPLYGTFYDATFPIYPYGPGILLISLMVCLFYRMEFRRYKSSFQAEEASIKRV